MRFHWFAQASYPHLPESFPEQHDSAWVDTPAHLGDPALVGETLGTFVRLLQYADEVGFDGLGVNEHHQTPFAMTPSPNLIASVLACTTKNAALLIIGNSLAMYNPPIRIAEELAVLDCLSGGRVIAGFVVGTPMDSTFSYGIPPAEVRERFAEARELIVRSWQAEEAFAFNGRFTQLRYVNPWPRPIQQPPPIWVPGTGSPETWDLVLDEGYGYGHLSFAGARAAKPAIDLFWDRAEERGFEVNPNRMALTQIVCVSDSEKNAEREYADAIRYYNRNNPIPPRFALSPGYATPRAQRLRFDLAGKAKKSGTSPSKPASEMSFWELDEIGAIIAGTPETVRERIREIATELRVGQFVTSLHFGNLSEEAARKNTCLFGTEVIPHLRDVWAELPDHWTPVVSQERCAANAAEIGKRGEFDHVA